MADITSATTWTPFLFDLQTKMQENFPTEHPFTAELSGVGDADRVGRFTRDMDTNRSVFTGDQVRVSLLMNEMQGGGTVSETGTWNVPTDLNTKKALVDLARVVQPFSLSVDVERDSLDNSNARAVAVLTKQARQALASIEEDMFVGNGDALLATVTDAATSLTITVSAATENFDRVYPGRIVDVLNRTTGADPGQGKRRKIDSFNETTGVLTFNTAQQASDGGSGAIVHSATDGIFIAGSFGTAAQGIRQIAAATGTFQSLDKAANQGWQGTDGRAGDTAALPLSDQILDKAVRYGRRAGLGSWDFGMGHPATVDLYKQGKYGQVKYEPGTGKLRSGFSGILYEGADRPFPIVKNPFWKRKEVELIDKESLQLYGDQVGPAFLDDDGSMFRRFTRALPKEADLLDRVQLVAMRCNTTVKVGDLTEAS